METHSAIITCLYQICLLKVSPVGNFKHLPDGRGMQITAYFCTQLASKSSFLILYIVLVSYQPISVYFWMVKMCKIQRENILQRPIPVKYNRLDLEFMETTITFTDIITQKAVNAQMTKVEMVNC